MTDLTMTELAVMTWEFVDTPRTEDEIRAMLVRNKVDPDVASRFPAWASGRGYIRIHDAGEKCIKWCQGKHPRGNGSDAE